MGCVLYSSDHSDVEPLTKRERLELPSSKDELDKEIEIYFSRVEKPEIPYAHSSSDLDDFN